MGPPRRHTARFSLLGPNVVGSSARTVDKQLSATCGRIWRFGSRSHIGTGGKIDTSVRGTIPPTSFARQNLPPIFGRLVPSAMSFRICFSTVRSAIARRSCAFSFLQFLELLGLRNLQSSIFFGHRKDATPVRSANIAFARFPPAAPISGGDAVVCDADGFGFGHDILVRTGLRNYYAECLNRRHTVTGCTTSGSIVPQRRHVSASARRLRLKRSAGWRLRATT